MKKIGLAIFVILLLGAGFYLRSRYKAKKVALVTTPFNSEVIYSTEKANFHFDRGAIIKYCEKQNDGDLNDFVYPQIIEYIKSSRETSVTIPDTLGTHLIPENELESWRESTELIRVRNQKHPYAYITDDVSWAVIEFARKGRLRIFDKTSEAFQETIIVEDINTSDYGETNLKMKNDSIILSELRYIR